MIIRYDFKVFEMRYDLVEEEREPSSAKRGGSRHN